MYELCLGIVAVYPDWVQGTVWQRQWLMMTDRGAAPSSHDKALISLSAQISAHPKKKGKKLVRSDKLVKLFLCNKIIKPSHKLQTHAPATYFELSVSYG